MKRRNDRRLVTVTLPADDLRQVAKSAYCDYDPDDYDHTRRNRLARALAVINHELDNQAPRKEGTA